MELAIVWAEGLLLLLLPGRLLWLAFEPRPTYDRFVSAASQIALGLAFWPIVFLWTSTLGFHWSLVSARLFIGALALLLIIVELRHRRHIARIWNGTDSALVAVIGLTALTRITQIRDVVLPLWVDSVHHTMIVRLLLEHGAIPDSYAPFIPHSSFYYHWGFHAVVAFVGWLHGWSPENLPRLLLDFGQFLNALTPLAVYAAARALLARRSSALIAAVLAGLVSLFPAYYVSWGRYTHLCGILLLPLMIVSLRRVAKRASWGNVLELTIFAAGLALIHVRVAFFAFTFAVVAGCALLVSARRAAAVRWIGAAAVAVVLTAPWVVRLAENPSVHKILAPDASDHAQWSTANGVPDDLLWAPHNAILMSLATGGLFGFLPVKLSAAVRTGSIVLWLALIVVLERRRRFRRSGRTALVMLAILACWTGLTALIINLDRFGIPRFRAVTNSSGIISLFFPMAIAGGCIAFWLIAAVTSPRRRRTAIIAAALLAALAGGWSMLWIINPRTLLARRGDLEALQWIRQHTPPDSVFAVGIQPWITGSYVGVDGGYWIPLMTDRASILPPGLYPWVAPASDVARTQRLLGAVTSATREQLLPVLRSAGVTHAYVGPSNRLTSWRLLRLDPRVSVIYDRDDATILQIPPAAGGNSRTETSRREQYAWHVPPL